MRSGQRLLAAVCVLAIALSFSLSAFASPPFGQGWMPPGLAKKADKFGWLFLDADQAPWAFPYFAELALKGIFQGDKGLVRPNQPVTIVEAIALCVRLIGREDAALARSNASLPYGDARTIPAWATGYVAVALEHGIIASHGGHLHPNRAAERLTVAVMVVRALGREAEAQARVGQALPFRDAASVPPWAVGYLVVALDLGILTGYPGGTVQPHKPVTRAEMAALLSRAGQYLDGEHRSEVAGEVVAVKTAAPRTLTLKHAAGTTTYPVATYCAVYAGAQEKSLADLKPGDRVKAYLNAVGEVVFVAIQAQLQVREGTLYQIVPPSGSAAGYVAITDLQGNRVRWALAPGAHAVSSGQVIPFTQLQPGMWVKVHLEGNLAAKIELVSAEPVRGMVVETGVDQQGRPATLRLQLAQGGTVTYQVLATVQVTYQGQPATFASLRPGDQVEISFADGRAARIVILVRTATVTGTVQSTQVNQHGHPAGITLRSGQTYTVAADVIVTSPAGQPLAFTALKPGDQVELHLEEQVVQRIRVLGQALEITGTVVEIGRNAFGHPESITLQVADVGRRTYAVAVDVRVTLDGVPMEFAAILPGDRAALKLQGDLVREIAVTGRAEVVTGEVTDRTVNSYGHPQSITVRLSDGRQRQLPVAVTVEVTYAGNPSTFVQVLVGDRVELTVVNGQVTRIVVASRAQTVTGTVRSRELNAYGHPHRITLQEGPPYPVAAAVTVTYGNNPLAFADLRSGDRVELRLEAGVVITIRVLSRTAEVTGALVERTVNAYGHPVSITLRTGNQNQLYPVAPDLEVYRTGAPAAFATLLAEDYVLAVVEGDRVTTVTVLVRADAFTGLVKGLNSADRTLLVRVTADVPGGLPVTLDRLVKVTSATVISRAGQTLTFADLALEQGVAVTASWEDGKFLALTIIVD